ncbi:FRG domain-containing protein [Ketobacter sp.]|uniref:FRG domain-containing protein n=1 Tax=Ketobacter sp. TaxID=2083498 RepID=UPI0025BA8283|nr:FRG domain-containing protein [Ketobacter sp.]
MKVVAKISNHNPDHSLFYRGQPRDYTINTGATSVYPTIYRSPGRSLTIRELRNRYDVLEACSSQLMEKLQTLKIENSRKLYKFPELIWSILQHYEVCATPLLDVTHSLRVASSFALNNASNDALILIFGFPYPNGTISYYAEQELLNIRLLSTCPSEALRPHFQEGFLLGNFPHKVERKQPHLDFATRLIAKIKISKEGFWENDFHPIPDSALYPDGDRILDICEGIKVSANV